MLSSSHPQLRAVALNPGGGRVRQVRDALNLTYDVTLELSVFHRLPVGWWIIHVMSRPGSISDAVAASLRVLRNVTTSRIRDGELLRAKRAVLSRMESDAKVQRLGPGRSLAHSCAVTLIGLVLFEVALVGAMWRRCSTLIGLAGCQVCSASLLRVLVGSMSARKCLDRGGMRG